MKILQEITVPQENVNDQYVQVVEIYHKNGDYVEKGDLLIDMETSKTVFSLEAQTDGYVKYLCQVGDEVPVGQTIIQIFDQDFTKISSSEAQQFPQTDTGQDRTKFSQKAWQYIIEHNISTERFAHYDFVNLDDVYRDLNIRPGASAKRKDDSPSALPEGIILKPLSAAKKREIEYLRAVQGENLTSLVSVLVDTKGLDISRYMKILKDSFLPLIVFETARLLRKYPWFNAFYYNDQVAIYNDVNIGIALDMGKGLKIGRIANADKLTIYEIEQRIFDLANKYMDDKLTSQDTTDITFSITDLYHEDVFSFIPLINKNNSAILGISSSDPQTKRFMLTLSFDHRVSEGRQAAMFLNDLRSRIESYIFDPENLGEQITCYKCHLKLKDDISGIGFVKVMTVDGEKYICTNCLKGL